MKTLTYISVALLLFGNTLYAQDSAAVEEREMLDADFVFTYHKDTQSRKRLECSVKIMQGKESVGIKGATVIFAADTELGKATTDEQGMAFFYVPDNAKIEANDEGAVTYTASFDGNDSINAVSAEVSVIDANLEVSIDTTGGARNVIAKLTRTLPDGTTEVVTDLDVFVYVQRLYSQLKVADIWLDKDAGEGSAVFPDGIPGDNDGNLDIVVKIEENEQFANIEKVIRTPWGVAVSNKLTPHQRALWSDVAPLWMTITLFIFLAGVLYHFVRIFINLYKIKKLGQAK